MEFLYTPIRCFYPEERGSDPDVNFQMSVASVVLLLFQHLCCFDDIYLLITFPNRNGFVLLLNATRSHRLIRFLKSSGYINGTLVVFFMAEGKDIKFRLWVFFSLLRQIVVTLKRKVLC